MWRIASQSKGNLSMATQSKKMISTLQQSSPVDRFSGRDRRYLMSLRPWWRPHRVQVTMVTMST